MVRFRMMTLLRIASLPLALIPAISRAAEIPHAQTLIDIQNRCDVATFRKLNWAEARGLGGLALKTWSILSDFSVEEIPGRAVAPMSRKFKVRFKAWDLLVCGTHSSQIPRSVTPTEREIVMNLREWSKDDHRLFLAMDSAVEGNQFLFTSIEDGLSDESGLTCWASKERFAKDIAVVNLDLLCKDEPAAKRKNTVEYLKALQTKLR